MRFTFSLLFLFFAFSPLAGRAQEQEKKISSRIEQILKPNEHKTFDPSTHTVGGVRSFSAGAARSKEFHFEEKSTQNSKAYSTRDFGGSKGAWMGDFKFATTAAKTDTNRVIPNTDKKTDTKTAATKVASESNKTSATRALYDGKREYLGPESKKLGTPIFQDKQYGWKGNLDKMSIDDVRDLLNKTK